LNEKILVTYASRAGSTAGVAEAISDALIGKGAKVDVMPMQDVKALSPYLGVVAGSALQKSKWLPEAMQFVQCHQAALAQKPLVVFTVCITLAMSNKDQYRQAVAKWVEPVRLQVRPVSEGLFAGLLDFSKLPLTLDNLLLRAAVFFRVFPKGDHRDWNAIRAWAESIHPLLLR
jgi:menaquinone-dependent protoporphyrinogen oxidase